MTTIPKIRILDAFAKDSGKLNMLEAIMEWFSNTTYSESKKTFVDIRNNEGKMELIYACDQSNPEVDINKMISFKSSHNINGEIGHHGDGFKRFSFKHNAELEIYSLNENTFDYVTQKQSELIKLIEAGVGNAEFERRMDTSEFTIFKQTKEMEDLPARIRRILEDDDMPFAPKFIVLFRNLNENMPDYSNYNSFESLHNCLQFINYQHIDEIHIRNAFLEKYKEFSPITGFDIRGTEHINYQHTFNLYKSTGTVGRDTVYYLKYVEGNIAFELGKVGNRNVRNIIEVSDLDGLDYLSDITMREITEAHNRELLSKLKGFKKQSIVTPSNLLEKYAGIYIILNDIPINYISSTNDWLPASKNLPGRSKYRCIVEPKSDQYMPQLIDTEGVKSNSRLSLAGIDWKFIIKSNINTILETYRKVHKDNLEENNVLTENIITGTATIPTVAKDDGNLVIIKLNENDYYYGTNNSKSFNINTFIPKIKKLRTGLKISNVAHPVFIKPLINVNDAKEIFEDTIESSELIDCVDGHEGFFNCDDFTDLFTLQGQIYQNLIDANIYN
jgi:hypothetical protein